MRHRVLHASAAVILLAAAPASAAAPNITQFAPTQGSIGTAVKITGTTLTGATAVTFAGVSARYSVNSAVEITAYLPASPSGSIAVTTPGGATTSTAKFTVTPGAQSSPTLMHPNGTITVTASGMDPYTAIDVYFDTTDEALSVSNGSGVDAIAFRLPVNATPGTHYITFDERSSHKAAQTPITVSTGWLQAAFGANNSDFNPYEGTLGSTTVPTLDILWANTDGGLDNFSNVTPLVEQAGIIVAGDVHGVVRAYAAATGSLVWTASAFTDFSGRSPVIYGGNVYLTDGVSVFAYKISCGSKGTTCTPIWTKAIPNFEPQSYGGLSLFNGTLYASGADGNVYPLDPSTGAFGASFYAVNNTYGPITSSVAFSADGSFGYSTLNTVLASFSNGFENFYTGVNGVSGVAFSGSLAFFESGDDVLHELNGRLWTAVLGGSSGCVSTPAVAYGTVFVGDCNAIYAYSAGAGTQLWSSIGFGAVSGLAVANHVIYACGGNTIYAIDASEGGLLWSGGYCNGAPIVANGSVYSHYGLIYAYTIPSLLPNVVQHAPSPLRLKPDLSLVAQPTSASVNGNEH